MSSPIIPKVDVRSVRFCTKNFSAWICMNGTLRYMLFEHLIWYANCVPEVYTFLRIKIVQNTFGTYFAVKTSFSDKNVYCVTPYKYPSRQ